MVMADNSGNKKLMQAFFSPAVALMNRLDVTRKFVLLGLMSLVAIAVVVYSLFASLDQVISVSQRELKGLELIKPFPRVVQMLQQHRGLSAGLLGGNETMRDRRASMEREAVEALNEVWGKPFSGMASGEDLQHIKADWERLSKEGLNWENFAAHTRLINRIQSFEGIVADEYALILDPELGTFYLIDTIVNKLPQALEHLGQLRAHCTGILAKKQATAQQKIEINILIAELDDALGMLKTNLDKTGRYNPALQGLILAASGNITDSAQQITGLVASDILTGHFATLPNDFFGMSTAVIDKSYTQLYETLLPMAETLIKARVARAENTLRTSVGIAFLLFLAVVYFSIGICRAIIGNIRSLARSARAFAGGDLRERIDCGARDEFGQVGDSFNEMADGFSALLKVSRENEVRLHELSVHLEERVKERTIELEQAQIEIRAMLRRYKTLMLTSMDGIHIMDTQGNIVEANDAFCSMLGYTREEVAGLNVADWEAQYSAAQLREKFKTIIGKSALFETLHRRKDGTLVNVEVSVNGVEMEGLGLLFATSRDITERKRAEAELRIAATAFETQEGMTVTDASGVILRVNHAFTGITGYTAEEAIGKTPRLLKSGRHDAAFYAAMWESIQRTGVWKGEIWNRRKNGEVYPEYHSITAVKGGNGEVSHYVGAMNDITARKQIETQLVKSVSLLHATLESTNDAILVVDLNSTWVLYNQKFVDLWHITDEIIAARDDSAALSYVLGQLEDADGFLKKVHELYATPEASSFDILKFKDGKIIERYSLPQGLDSKVVGRVWSFRDITERKKAEEQLRIAAATFETHEAILITDVNANIIRVNQAFTDITGYSSEEVLGKNPRILSSGRQDKAFYAAMWQQLLNTGSWSGEMWDRRKSGQIYPKWLTITAVKNEAGKITGYVAMFSDITARKQAEEEIHNLAFYDALTKLPNRRLFLDRFHTALTASARHNNFGAVLFIDLDRFKLLNDTLGHDYGDLLLIEVAVRIKACVREMDTVARLGGDEFVVLIESVSDDQDEASHKVGLVAEKTRESLARPYNLNGHEHHSSPSIGVSLYRGNEEPVDELLQHADMAMYQAKDSGRNAVRFFDPAMQNNVATRAALVNDLRGAIAHRQLHLHYQLQVDNDNRPVGAEALLRWIHPQRGMVMPDQFLPIAEESTLILDIGDWVLETACRQLALWGANGKMRDLVLTVNVSAKQFAMPGFADKVADALQTHQISPARLKLELTESMALDDLPGAVEKMHALKALGVRLSMDDFGTRYSSLSNLKQLPLDQLKLGRSFVHDIASDGNVALLVQSIIDLSSKYRITVIAEGVENEAQLTSLKDRDCVAYQGFLFSKALAIEEFEQLLNRS